MPSNKELTSKQPQQRNLSPVLFPILGRKSSGELTVPLDNARASLFDTAYVHPLLRNHSALWTFYNVYVRTFLWLNTGTPEGLDQVVGEPDPHKNHVSRSEFTLCHYAHNRMLIRQ